MPSWLQRWNFIERAKLERQLWEAFERGENLEEMVAECRRAVEGGTAERAFQLEVWQTTLQRIRKIEAMMAGRAEALARPGLLNRRPHGPGVSSSRHRCRGSRQWALR